MRLEERINEDIKTAMKNKDQVRLRGLRAVKSAILLAKTEKAGTQLDEDAGIKLLQKLVKQRQDSLDIYTKQGRADLAAKEEEEIAVIQAYLPRQMSEAEVEQAIGEIMTESGASSMKDMGKVMGMASQRLAGRADNRMVADLVKKKLSG